MLWSPENQKMSQQRQEKFKKGVNDDEGRRKREEQSVLLRMLHNTSGKAGYNPKIVPPPNTQPNNQQEGSPDTV